MLKRRRFKQSLSLKDRLALFRRRRCGATSGSAATRAMNPRSTTGEMKPAEYRWLTNLREQVEAFGGPGTRIDQVLCTE